MLKNKPATVENMLCAGYHFIGLDNDLLRLEAGESLACAAMVKTWQDNRASSAGRVVPIPCWCLLVVSFELEDLVFYSEFLPLEISDRI
jgi:hypothetical protein